MSVTYEVRRATHERLDEALELLDGLDQDGADIEQAVHDVRKRCKEARAIARLVRSSAGVEYPRFNQLVRDAAETLAPIRDAHALLATFDALRSASAHDPELDDVRAGLAALADAATPSAQGGDPRIVRVDGLLRAARKSLKRWRVNNGFATLRVGVDDTYRAGRKELRRAVKKPADDRLHEWRKSVKHLWYQMRLVQRAAPSVLEPLVSCLDDLADALGDDHDLAVLIERIQSDPDQFGGKSPVSHAVCLARSQQDDLRRRALRLGATIYAEKPGAFARRIEVYWNRTVDDGPELLTGGIAELAGDEGEPTAAPPPPTNLPVDAG